MGYSQVPYYFRLVFFPRSAAPPCGGNPPAAAQCVGSWPKSLHQRSGRPALWQGKNAPMSEYLRPSNPVSSIVCFRSSTLSGGRRWLTNSHFPLLWGGAPVIWMKSLSPVAFHMPVTPLLRPPVPHPPPVPAFYSMCPACKGRRWCGGGWAPPMAQMCYKQYSGGEGSYLFPDSLLTCSSPRHPLFEHALSFECTSKLCITFLDQF